MNWLEWLPTIVLVASATIIFLIAQGVTAAYRSRLYSRNTLGGARGPAWGVLTWPLAYAIPYGVTGSANKLDRVLRRAGDYTPSARWDFLASRNAMVIAGLLLWALAWYVTRDEGPVLRARVLLGGVFLVGALFVFPRLYLEWRGNRRVQAILRGIPDALDLIALCVSAGLPLQEALTRIQGRVREIHPDLCDELDIVRRQAEISTLDRGTRDLATRLDEPELHALASVVSDAQSVGVNVGAVLRDYAESIRRTHRQRAEGQSNRLAIHLLFPILLCLAPSAYLMMLTPSVIELRRYLERENEAGGALDTKSATERVRQPMTSNRRSRTP